LRHPLAWTGWLPDRYRETGGFLHRIAHALRGLRQRLARIELLGAGHVDVELVARRLFDRRRELFEDLSDFAPFLDACLHRDRDDGRVGAEAEGARHRHG
jgi:hypothetical protein